MLHITGAALKTEFSRDDVGVTQTAHPRSIVFLTREKSYPYCTRKASTASVSINVSPFDEKLRPPVPSVKNSATFRKLRHDQ
jgi:hypothetical protein